MSKTIYNYQPDTGEFVSISFADISPLEQGVFLIPAFATDIAPPKTKVNQVAVFVEGKWKIQNIPIPAKPSASEALELARQTTLMFVDHLHTETIQKLVGNWTESEKQTWPLKLETAKAIIDETSISAEGMAFLDASGMTQQETKDWAAAVLARSASYALAAGIAEKIRYTAREAIKTATDEATIKTILEAQRTAADKAIEEWIN